MWKKAIYSNDSFCSRGARGVLGRHNSVGQAEVLAKTLKTVNIFRNIFKIIWAL